jgi:hypothetical protein
MAGLGRGARYATSHAAAPDADALLTMLQPVPIEIFAD